VRPGPDHTTLVIGCGALGRELATLVRVTGLANSVTVRCLPAGHHNRPERIPPAVDRAIREIRAAAPERRIFVAYGDCGTGGRLDSVLAGHGVERLPGAHCYQFYTGMAAFDDLAAEEPGTFFLTDYLARNFDRLVIAGMGLDRYPELLDMFFVNYRRLVYLSQQDEPSLLEMARAAADRLGLAFEHRRTGFGEMETAIRGLAPAGASGAGSSGSSCSAGSAG
jgi:hypothetical protein